LLKFKTHVTWMEDVCCVFGVRNKERLRESFNPELISFAVLAQLHQSPDGPILHHRIPALYT